MAPAAAQAGNGWYVGLEGGANFLRSQDLKVYDSASRVQDGFELAHVRFDTGWIAGGVIGYTYEDYGLHPEFAFEYRRNDFDFLRASAKNLYPGESTHDVDGYEAAYSILFNLWYDFNKTGRLKPYIGIGGGAARVEFHNAGYSTPLFPNSELSNDHDLGYAYQAGAGLSYDLTPHWTLSADYRYFATEPNRFDLNGNDDSSIKTPYRASTAMLGIRYFFGKPPEPPAPVPPVEVVPPVTPPPPPPPPPPPCEGPATGKTFTLEGCNVGDKVVLRGVNFEFDKATLTPDAKVLLDMVSDALLARTDIMVELDGHTDSKGSDEYNQKLSERRSESVKQYLVGRGIDAGRMTTMGFGESQPVQDNATDEGREYNRRVELKVTASNGNVVTEAARPE